MTGAEGDRVVRLNNDRGGVRSYHGPVKREGRAEHLEITAFTGSEESDVLHAAADWIKERPFALIVAMNWRSDHPAADDALLWTLELVVDHSANH